MIDIKDLKKTFGENVVLDHFSHSFAPGKVYGIVGENGAGKTTLFRCIAGFESFEGEVTSSQSPLKNYLGYLPTEPFFFEKMTGREYLQLLCNARGVTVSDLDEKNFFELPLHQFVSTYSTGMKKKLALTGILLQSNDYFILDEPFNGLDIQSNMMLTEVIHQLKAKQKIVIISSHIFSTLADTCDEIIHLKKGHPAKVIPPTHYQTLESELREAVVSEKLGKMFQ